MSLSEWLFGLLVGYTLVLFLFLFLVLLWHKYLI